MIDFSLQRRQMVQTQLAQRGISDERVLSAIARVPRDRFVDPDSLASAYADRALAIACGQTISQPYIVALMSEALRLDGSQRVLEIGTGSGYQTAILAELACEVFTIERHRKLSQQAARVLVELGYRRVHFLVGDGCQGWPELSPIERVIVTAAAAEVPPALIEQLAEGGILVIPIGDEEEQILQAFKKQDGRLTSSILTHCRFVRLVRDC